MRQEKPDPGIAEPPKSPASTVVATPADAAKYRTRSARVRMSPNGNALRSLDSIIYTQNGS